MCFKLSLTILSFINIIIYRIKVIYYEKSSVIIIMHLFSVSIIITLITVRNSLNDN